MMVSFAGDNRNQVRKLMTRSLSSSGSACLFRYRRYLCVIHAREGSQEADYLWMCERKWPRGIEMRARCASQRVEFHSLECRAPMARWLKQSWEVPYFVGFFG